MEVQNAAASIPICCLVLLRQWQMLRRASEFGTLEKASIFFPSFLPASRAVKWNERSERMDGMKDELPFTDSPS